MSRLITHPKWRWFTILVAVSFITVTSFFLQNAAGRPRRFAPVSGFAQRSAIYSPDIAGFTFSIPQALTHAPIPAVSPCPVPSPNPLGLGCPSIKDQGIEPEIKVDIFGNVYVTAIHGYPGGVDLWKSTDKGMSFVYLGEPDGTQDKCVTGVTPCIGGAGGGEKSMDWGSANLPLLPLS